MQAIAAVYYCGCHRTESCERKQALNPNALWRHLCIALPVVFLARHDTWRFHSRKNQVSSAIQFLSAWKWRHSLVRISSPRLFRVSSSVPILATAAHWPTTTFFLWSAENESLIFCRYSLDSTGYSPALQLSDVCRTSRDVKQKFTEIGALSPVNLPIACLAWNGSEQNEALWCNTCAHQHYELFVLK